MSREELIYMSKVCEETEQFNEMLDYIRKILKMGNPVSIEERNLLSIAFKNSVGNRRSALRCLQNIEKKENDNAENENENENLKLIELAKKKIEDELDLLCDEIINEIDNNFLPSIKKKEDEEKSKEEILSEVFFLKMKGDYCRYKSEYLKDKKKEDASNLALKSYDLAIKISEDEKKGLKTTHPIRLGLALNFSVFYYEVKKNTKKACEIAKKSFDNAIADVEDIEDIYYKDSTTIMQLIRDNLTFWNSEINEEEEEDKED